MVESLLHINTTLEDFKGMKQESREAESKYLLLLVCEAKICSLLLLAKDI